MTARVLPGSPVDALPPATPAMGERAPALISLSLSPSGAHPNTFRDVVMGPLERGLERYRREVEAPDDALFDRLVSAAEDSGIGEGAL